jgi:hypothetical protein
MSGRWVFVPIGWRRTVARELASSAGGKLSAEPSGSVIGETMSRIRRAVVAIVED